MPKALWTPSQGRIAATNLKAFMAAAERDWGTSLPDFADLHRWSVAKPEEFWISVWEFGQVIAETRGARVLVDGEKMPGARFFPDARLNFAENLLRRRDDTDAMVFWGEDQERRRLSWRELHDLVSRLHRGFKAAGIGPGDRVGAYMPNMPETMAAMLAAASLGAVWSSCSPDFGVQGVLDRFSQIEPKLLVSADGYHYNGKRHSSLEKLAGVLARLPSVERVVVVPYLAAEPDLAGLGDACTLADFLAPHSPGEIAYHRHEFNAPLYILYSSGTTGAPKCIVHGQGGTLLKHLVEHKLHCDVKPGDRIFYFTTCGWMMWNWLVSGLASEATLLLYDGSPFYPHAGVLFDLAEAERMTLFGTGAKYIDAIRKHGLRPIDSHDLSHLRTMTSTGSPLVVEGFEYVYDAIKGDLHLASISGGTDIVGCFVAGDPTAPVHAGEIQAPGLGMEVAVFDEAGRPMAPGEKGELVCTKSFPSLPVGFWNDPDGRRYHEAYFDVYPGAWRHGDFIARTVNGGYVIYGRSDATLNPGGVRIGTAEIYRQVEALEEVVEGLVVGQDWEDDTRVVLFVRLTDGLALDDELTAKIKAQIRRECTPRHVPAKVIQVADIPRTVSGKITELAVRDVIHGRAVKNKEALANPEALELYRDLPELRAG
ncbi:MAG: acetoacetate--CoA ligase [Alphaproteobacteria bacterium]